MCSAVSPPCIQIHKHICHTATVTLYTMFIITISLRFNGHFPAGPWLDGFIGAKDARGGGDNWNY